MTEPNKPVYKKKFLYMDKFTDHQTEDLKWKKIVMGQIRQMDVQIMILSFAIAAVAIGTVIMWVFYK